MTKTYRDLFKWGSSHIEETIDDELAAILKQRIGVDPVPITSRPGSQPIEEKIDTSLSDEIIAQFTEVVGEDDLSTTTGDLLEHATGASYTDVLRIRERQFTNYPQAVVYPETDDEIAELMDLCRKHDIAIIPVGGMTSVTEGIAYPTAAISVDLTRHYTDIIEINSDNFTVTAQAGIMGPALEEKLQQYVTERAPAGFTCGHFPQSFEFSTLGGWVVTRSAGQESTGYGKIEDMVLGLRMISPEGPVEVPVYPARATGPDLLQFVVGSEGALGIVTEVTIKIRKRSTKTNHAAFLFKTWQDGLHAVQRIMQERLGDPYLFRLSDPEESDIYLEMSNLASWKAWIIKKLGYLPGKRVLLMCTTTGYPDHANQVMASIKSVVKSYGGFHVGGSPVEEWKEERFHTPYLRAALMDQNLIIDTLETACQWDNIHHLWNEVRNTIKSRPNTIVMVHLSHMYETGANLYFIFITPASTEDRISDYLDYQRQIITTIKESGGSLSHHHGIGRLYAPFLEEQLGTAGMRILKAVKEELDPKYLMNPGVLNLP